MRLEQQLAKMKEYEEEVQVGEDTKIYKEKSLKSGEVCFLAKGAKVYRRADTIENMRQ